ncbi:SPW repeat protein [Natronococcus sp. A-GB7]|uniref:SPW repeat domain-containing protein n=1 Tax=Natronococcus sp. A-GB7 TaxID=3037649 RepID=UPI00242037BF|nr:SPW repeat protein [Natronococcus sp. A-GB7]MDG5817689.1 SPW repeat protein [Natronococcus sp. A-GB7]
MSTVSERQSTRTTRLPPVPRLAGLAAVLGTWIFWSGVFVTGFGWIVTNNVLVGAVAAAFAAYTAARPSGGRLPGPVAPLIVLVAGAWTVAAPFVFGIETGILFWSNVVAGALVAVLAAACLYGGRKLDADASTSA